MGQQGKSRNKRYKGWTIERVKLGRVPHVLEYQNGKEGYACFSGDTEVALDSHGEATYSSSSHMRSDGTTTKCITVLGPERHQ